MRTINTFRENRPFNGDSLLRNRICSAAENLGQFFSIVNNKAFENTSAIRK
jgi:hypothetical protein